MLRHISLLRGATVLIIRCLLNNAWKIRLRAVLNRVVIKYLVQGKLIDSSCFFRSAYVFFLVFFLFITATLCLYMA